VACKARIGARCSVSHFGLESFSCAEYHFLRISSVADFPLRLSGAFLQIGTDAGGCGEGLAMPNRLGRLLHSESAYTACVVGLGVLTVVLVTAMLFLS
jgi:hypothetical protein